MGTLESSAMRFAGLALLVACALTHSVQAQSIHAQVGLNGMLGLPQGPFKQNLDAVGFGGGALLGVSSARTPLMVGVELSGLIYGRDTREVPLSTTIPDLTVEVVNSNNIVFGHLLLRFQPPTGFIRPYLDGLIGLNYLFTQTSINDVDDNFNDDVLSSRNLDDVAFSFGPGGGVMIRLWQGVSEDGKPYDLLLDARLRYLFGGEAEYLAEGDILIEDGEVSYDISTSTTDILLIQLGVMFKF